MGIARNQWLIALLFALSMLILVILGGVAWENYAEVVAVHRQAAQSDDVLSAGKEARKAFNDAVLYGRMEMIGMPNGTPKETLRAVAEEKARAIVAMVGESQTANAKEVAAAVAHVFRKQDEAIALSSREQGSLVIPIERNLELIEALHRADKAFYSFEAHENTLSRQMHAVLTEKEIHVARLFLALIFLALTATSAFAYFARSAYGRVQRGRDAMSVAINGQRMIDQQSTIIALERENLRLLKAMEETIRILDR